MTADASNQTKSTTGGTLLPTLALVFAVLTLLFALLSMVLGNRVATVSRDQVDAQKNAAVLETTTVENTQAALQEARKQVETEKAGAEKIRKQLAGAMQEVKKLKADLAKANQTIEMIQNKAAAVSVPQPAPLEPATPQMPSPVKATAETGTKAAPASNTPQTQAPAQLPADVPEAVQEKSTPASQPQTMAPVPDNQKPRLEESTIQPGSSETNPGAAGTSHVAEPAAARQADAGPAAPKPTTTDKDAAE